MAYRVLTLPVHDPGAAETELNGFLASHRVLSVDRRFVEMVSGQGSPTA